MADYNEVNKFKIISALAWKLMERAGTQGIQFLVQILLARLLAPEDYGIVALISVFIAIANVFVQSGFNTALIQKKDADDVDFSSVFYLCVANAVLLYSIIFFAAPLMASFYNAPDLMPVIRVLSIILILGAFNSIQNTVIAKKLVFKKLFFSSLGAIIISGVVGIALAYMGYGVWALIGQQIANQLSITVILWVTVKWRPKLVFSLRKIKGLFAYGWKLLASSLIETLAVNLRSLIIGKMYSPLMLGYYTRGEHFPQIIVTNINGSIQSVMFPALASHQNDRKRVKDMVRRSIVTSSFIVFPMMIGLASVAEPLVKILLTEKWLPSVPFLQIACMSYAIFPIHTANLQAINALGRSDVFLKLEIIKKIIGFAILGVSVFYGVYAIAVGLLAAGIISSFINAYPNNSLLNYSYKEQIKDIIPSLLSSLTMGIIIYSINFIGLPPVAILTIQVILGGAVYIAMAKIFKFECLSYLIDTVKEIFKGKAFVGGN